ncbi:MAG: glycosyltransferase [Planctomycetaceae bacterium]|nr:glycosyltransferase [Planctomycetaceae bacterium]
MTVDDFSDGNAASDCDVVVLPSTGESLSNAILEAMAAGIPVIAARSGGNAELVRHKVTGLLVPPLQPRALAGALLSLLGDSSSRRHQPELFPIFYRLLMFRISISFLAVA